MFHLKKWIILVLLWPAVLKKHCIFLCYDIFLKWFFLCLGFSTWMSKSSKLSSKHQSKEKKFLWDRIVIMIDALSHISKSQKTNFFLNLNAKETTVLMTTSFKRKVPEMLTPSKAWRETSKCRIWKNKVQIIYTNTGAGNQKS
jgi:hypothetical protein